MNTSHRIKITGTIESRRRRPGLRSWLVLAGILLVASFVAILGLAALPSFVAFDLPAALLASFVAILGLAGLALFVAFYLPAALGSFMGWLVGGARDEVRTAWRICRRRL